MRIGCCGDNCFRCLCLSWKSLSGRGSRKRGCVPDGSVSMLPILEWLAQTNMGQL